MTDVVELAREHRVTLKAEIAKMDTFILTAESLMTDHASALLQATLGQANGAEDCVEGVHD